MYGIVKISYGNVSGPVSFGRTICKLAWLILYSEDYSDHTEARYEVNGWEKGSGHIVVSQDAEQEYFVRIPSGIFGEAVILELFRQQHGAEVIALLTRDDDRVEYLVDVPGRKLEFTCRSIEVKPQPKRKQRR